MSNFTIILIFVGVVACIMLGVTYYGTHLRRKTDK